MSHFAVRVKARASQGWHRLWVALVRVGFPPADAKGLTLEEAGAFLYEYARQENGPDPDEAASG